MICGQIIVGALVTSAKQYPERPVARSHGYRRHPG